MDVFDAIKARRAVKHYDTAHHLTEDEFQHLMQHVILSPTSYNIQNWRFVRITDPAMREKAKDIAWGQQQIQDASEMIVFCGALSAWNDQPNRYWRNAPDETRKVLVDMMANFYQGRDRVQRDEIMRSCGMAAQSFMLAAKAMGYDTNPMVGYDTERLAQLINLPEDYEIAMVIVLGKAAQAAHGRGGQLPLAEVLVENTF